MLRQEYTYTCLVMQQELNMIKYIKNLFKSKPAKKPYHPPYPQDELNNIREYKNLQHEKAMKAKIEKDNNLEDKIRKAGW